MLSDRAMERMAVTESDSFALDLKKMAQRYGNLP